MLTRDGWLRTGDLATRNRLGLIRLVGRMKDVIKSGGYSVYVRELEEAILAHPAVARAIAFGLPHKEKGEIPVGGSGVAAGRSGRRKRTAGVVPEAPRRLQSAAANLDSSIPAACRRIPTGRFCDAVLRERFSDEDQPRVC